MSYITRAELVVMFPDTFSSATDELWNQVIPAVDGVIDGRLSARYAVPIEPAPAALKEIATDLARYKLEKQLMYDEVKDDALETRYKFALDRLEQIADGTIALIGVASQIVGSPSFVAPKRIFSKTVLDDY